MTAQQFTQLGEQHLPYMRAQALRLTGSTEGANDLLQEAAYWAYRHREQFSPETNFRAWALTIIRNTFISAYRQNKRREELLANRPMTAEWSTRLTTFNPAEGQLGAQKIMEIIERLPVKFRHPFLLHFEGVKYREISLRLGIPVGTAKSRVHTARQRLRNEIEALYRLPA